MVQPFCYACGARARCSWFDDGSNATPPQIVTAATLPTPEEKLDFGATTAKSEITDLKQIAERRLSVRLVAQRHGRADQCGGPPLRRALRREDQEPGRHDSSVVNR
jgi:hypothetical protein